jgi:hypothetical protein
MATVPKHAEWTSALLQNGDLRAASHASAVVGEPALHHFGR